jgi:hypothetical protein
LYFDTDEGALLAYDGTDWVSGGGAFSESLSVPVSDWIGPYFMCCTASTGTAGCLSCCTKMFDHFNPFTCQLIFGGLQCPDTHDRCGYVKYLTFTPSNCGVTFNCCSCPCCCGCNGFHRPPTATSCCGCVLRIYGPSNSNVAFEFRDKTVFGHHCFNNCLYVVNCGTACDFCFCCVASNYYCIAGKCGGVAKCFDWNRQDCMCKRWLITEDRCCVAILENNAICYGCCEGQACTFSAAALFRFNGALPGLTPNVCVPLTDGCNKLIGGSGTPTPKPIKLFCNGLLYYYHAQASCRTCHGYNFACNDGTIINLNRCCCTGDPRCFFCFNDGSTFPTEIFVNNVTPVGKNYFMVETYGCRSGITRSYFAMFKHEHGSDCFDATAQCVMITRENITCFASANNVGCNASRFCFGFDNCGVNACCQLLHQGVNINNTYIQNFNAKFCHTPSTICTTSNRIGLFPVTMFLCSCDINPGALCGMGGLYLPAGSSPFTNVKGHFAARIEYDSNFGSTDCTAFDRRKYNGIPCDYLSFGCCNCGNDGRYGNLCGYGDSSKLCTCHANLLRWVGTNFTIPDSHPKLHVAVAFICKQCCAPPSTTAICKCAFYYRLYCG